METVNGVDHHQTEEDGGAVSVHAAARHGTATTVERLTQQLGNVRQLRRGVVDSTPAHDAAATGNIATLTWILGNDVQPCPM